MAIFDASNEEAILKITYPFRNLGIPHVNPALSLEESLKNDGNDLKTCELMVYDNDIKMAIDAANKIFLKDFKKQSNNNSVGICQ